MAEDREDLLRHYREMRAGLLAAIEGLSDEQLSEPTLDDWAVKDHLLHLAMWDEIRASEVERISSGQEPAWHMEGEQSEIFSGLVHDMRAGLSPEQAKWEITRSHERVMLALAAATPRGLDASLYAEAGLRSTHEAQHTEWIKRWRSERGYL